MEQVYASEHFSKQQAKELSNDVGQIVMVLQVQDIARQKLEHIEQALMQMRDHLQHFVDGTPAADLQDACHAEDVGIQLHHGSRTAGSFLARQPRWGGKSWGEGTDGR